MHIKKCRTCGGEIQIQQDMKDKACVSCHQCKQQYRIFSLYPPRPIHLRAMDTANDYGLED